MPGVPGKEERKKEVKQAWDEKRKGGEREERGERG